jgi:hypothetical protein
MATYSDILPDVRIEVSDAPKQVMLTAVVWACRELCDQSLAWVHTTDPVPLFGGNDEIDVDDIPKESELSRLLACEVDGRPLSLGVEASISMDGLIVRLANPVSGNCTATATMALRPTRSATYIPDWIASNHSDTVAHGALYRLQANPTKAWGNPQSAQFHYSQFRSGVARARIDAIQSGRQQTTLRVRPVRFA